MVDVELRVHGIKGLRVCDASISPDITSVPSSRRTGFLPSKLTTQVQVIRLRPSSRLRSARRI